MIASPISVAPTAVCSIDMPAVPSGFTVTPSFGEPPKKDWKVSDKVFIISTTVTVIFCLISST
ncbi:hypothetical protein Hanom_Chr11g00988921 [Helianthus anomalus]